ncbi:hypothetical protein B0H16DRAFT_1550573 [Mycena metata]|uniref:Uncharacterized protein n=1 Tax=Mycena metata TaxID=1033252 RepID=A0AAD7IT91_9AGAR|nr:hypothetical protein B0H16DRAFT_1550573 [Mycena metata]
MSATATAALGSIVIWVSRTSRTPWNESDTMERRRRLSQLVFFSLWATRENGHQTRRGKLRRSSSAEVFIEIEGITARSFRTLWVGVMNTGTNSGNSDSNLFY